MKTWPILLAAFLGAAAIRVEGAALDAKTRSVSGSGQFIIYCADSNLRGEVTGFADRVRADVLELLGDAGHMARIPIVMTLDRATNPAAEPVRLQLFATPAGSKIEINVVISDEPANLQKHIVRAVLLEYAYSDRPPIKGGERFSEAPWWLVAGAIEEFRRRDIGLDSSLFQRLVENNKLPSAGRVPPAASGKFGRDGGRHRWSLLARPRATRCWISPTGRENLARLVRHWPDHSDDPDGRAGARFPRSAGPGWCGAKMVDAQSRSLCRS